MMIAARNAFLMGGGGLPSGFTAYNYLRIIGTGATRKIDSGVSVPETGDFIAEIDFVHQPVGKYAPFGGVTTLSAVLASGFAANGYLSYRDINYFNGSTKSFSYKTPQAWPEVSVRFGIEGANETISVTNIGAAGGVSSQTLALIGGERGRAGDSFWWGANRSMNDNAVGTAYGAARLYAGGVVVWDGVPCVRDSDSAVGYYDFVNRAFCPAASGFEAVNTLT